MVKQTSLQEMYRVRLVAFAAGLLILACGCESDDGNASMAESFYLNPYKDVHSLGRVSLVELENASDYPDISSDMTTALFLALQKRQLFNLNVIHRDDPAWQDLRQKLGSLEGLKQIAAMRDTFKSDGVLVGTITQYQPYPRMVIGLRLKLLDLTDGQLLWGLEQVWDSTDRTTRKRIAEWTRSGPLHEDLVVMSSLNFSKFVAYEVGGTFIPKRTATR